MTHIEVLEEIYNSASKLALEQHTNGSNISVEVISNADIIISRSESNRAVLSVIVTLLTHKIIDPAQDIRYHYARMENGFSGRGIDTSYVTPFMKKVSFPAMKESGWKTNTLAIDLPYDLNYPGIINPKEIKSAFLNLIDQVQTQNADPKRVLLYIFTSLIKQRESMKVELAKPHSLSIADIILLLERHFSSDYKSLSGGSRLPTLAVYAAYQCMMNQLARYKGKILCPLENHNSADARSGRIGDIDINNADNTAFEGVEIKHEIVITKGLVGDAYEKFKIHNTDRYYLLTTANMNNADFDGINAEIKRISQIHGCQVIVNGVYSTLKYYLRLLDDTAEFIDNYVENMKADETIKFQHKTKWNEVVSNLH
ncbi:MAG: hypothetical protein LBM59_01295 [Ruminococcus sp.]|jgi:DNA (cytosine-5)-methyltransferase 1|nr:hypothetical protein [Ruminococcus sp.]